MLEATKANIKLAKKTASANLLEGLLVRKVGTNGQIVPVWYSALVHFVVCTS